MDKLVKHLEVSPIADLLIRLFISDEFHAGRMVSDWLLREDLVKKLIQRIHPSNKDIVSFSFLKNHTPYSHYFWIGTIYCI